MDPFRTIYDQCIIRYRRHLNREKILPSSHVSHRCEEEGEFDQA
jgi:hypothetical protein